MFGWLRNKPTNDSSASQLSQQRQPEYTRESPRRSVRNSPQVPQPPAPDNAPAGPSDPETVRQNYIYSNILFILNYPEFTLTVSVDHSGIIKFIFTLCTARCRIDVIAACKQIGGGASSPCSQRRRKASGQSSHHGSDGGSPGQPATGQAREDYQAAHIGSSAAWDAEGSVASSLDWGDDDPRGFQEILH